MLKLVLIAFLPFLFFFGDTTDKTASSSKPDGGTGTLKKMVPDGGDVALNLDLSKGFGQSRVRGASGEMKFSIPAESFLPILIFNDEVRTPLPGSMELRGSAQLPRGLKTSTRTSKLILEATPWGSDFEMVLRDENGMVFFGIEGLQYGYDPEQGVFSFENARLLMSPEYAKELGKPAAAGSIVGALSLHASMRAIEITNMVDGDVQRDTLPASVDAGSVPGPDVIVGDLNGLSQPDTGVVGGYVGLSVGTDSCNIGTVDLDWFQLPSNDHPVIPQNIYKMSGGPANNERFEQIGQSNVKHAFTALTQNICSLGCNGVGGTHLGSGCSDPYVVSLNSGGSGHSLGSRAWINPFTGNFPASNTVNTHTGHTHTAISHRMLVDVNDLNTTLNPGATYYAEAQYITPHEYVWCQGHPGQCNMYNNVSHRQYLVSGTTGPTFSFPASTFTTVREKSAVTEWTGASSAAIKPEPGVDGIGSASWKVTNPSAGVWHYEYAIYNQNIDRGIQSLDLPMGAPVTVTNVGFHAPPQQPGSANDGTFNSLGYSSTPWSSTRNAGDFLWSTETFAENQNANAIRWGTLYNFRFDANSPPMIRNVTIGFFKTGAPIIIQMQVPTALVSVSGKVTNADGRGVTHARVSITGDSGFLMSTFTDRKGNFTFNGVPSGGGAYTISALQRRFTFTPQVVNVNDTITDLTVPAS